MVGAPNAKHDVEAFPIHEALGEISLVPAADNALLCKACGIEMTLLGKIPNNWQHRQIVVYRCFGCDEVVSSED